MRVVGLHGAIARLMENRREDAAEGQRSPLLREIVARLQDRVSPANVPLLETFCRELFGRAQANVLSGSDPESLVELALGAFHFLLERRRNEQAVRVFRPERARNEWDTPHTVVETVLDDHPFIVDTVCETLRQQGGDVRLLLHPVLGVRRGEDGTLEQLGAPGRLPGRESFLHVEVAGIDPSRSLDVLLSERLRQLVLASRDYSAMKRRVADLAFELRAKPLPAAWAGDVEEVSAFLEWLGQKSFVYLGLREYGCVEGTGAGRAMIRHGSGLGILRDDGRSRYNEPRPLDPELERRVTTSGLLIVSKTNAQSPIHRLVPMTDVFLANVDESGKVRGGHRLLGLFTAKAYAEPASGLPILRRRLAGLLERRGALEDSYDHKDLLSLFDSISKEELLAGRPADLERLLLTITNADPTAGIRLVCRPDAWRRGLLAVVIVPRARFSTELHARISAMLRRNLGASVLHEHLALDDRPQARLHYYLAVPPKSLEGVPIAALERELDELLWTWDDEIGAELGKSQPPAVVERLRARYGRAFPAAYKAATPLAEAVRDIRSLEALIATEQTQIELNAAERRAAEGRVTALKLYSRCEPLALSDFVPLLERFGLRALDEESVAVELGDAGNARIRTFFVQAAADPDLDVAATAARLVPALCAVRDGRAANDRLNSLVLRAGLDWQQVDLLRAYVEHARQAGVGSFASIVEALVAHPESAYLLFRLFAARHDPASVPQPADEPPRDHRAAAAEDFFASLDSVESLIQDGILRALGMAVLATLRTNFYSRPDAGGAYDAIAIKLDAAGLPFLPEPRPMYETYVHAVHMEGIHLRAGRIARGGIRLSDRPDDFRAEIHGLMRTQMVKNAVIVPVGAKGGFVVKRPAAGQPADGAEVERAYRTLIDALLSITDNVEEGRVVPPHGVVLYDDPDPYLVVAADKGTASYSDLANEIAAARRFWLGDAFASGGRHGYDHKQLAITARGAWECARQHFRDVGRDIDRDPVTVIGIGDMSGDVFGNGMLRSRSIRLLAAFDHRHVFIDPAPEPERSYRERERLFALPRSSWTDYDRACLSPGGGVFQRTAKSVPLSAEIRALLETDAEALSGEDLVRAVLRVPADLLWNGGVGTYVKASDESHAEVGDRANDRVRADARDLRVRVVVEGGNLGLTQRARVELALAGCRLNTDAIDNSGGVDCSDHEVNLKIALDRLVRAGEISVEERNELLATSAADVCRAVLDHNRRQALALGLDQVRSRTRLSDFRDLLRRLEAEAGLDRLLHHLPSREALRARRSAYLGLTRPELAVLLAFAKLDLQRHILEAPLSAERYLDAVFKGYFPEDIRRRFETSLHDHPLRREITAVELANRLIDIMGCAFAHRLAADTGSSVADVAKAWTAAMAVSGGDDVLDRLTAAGLLLQAEVERRCCFTFEQALERATRWVLANRPAEAPLSETVDRFGPPVQALLAGWADGLTDEARAAHAAQIEDFVRMGVDVALAERLTNLAAIGHALEIAHIAVRSRLEPSNVARAYFETSALVDLDWIAGALARAVAEEDRWERQALAGLLEDLASARRRLTERVLECGRSRDAAGCIDAYAMAHRREIERVATLIHDLKAAAQPTLPAMLVVMREIGRLG